MAILVTSNKIFDIEKNDVVLDNAIKGVEWEEHSCIFENQNIYQNRFNIYSATGIISGNISDYEDDSNFNNIAPITELQGIASNINTKDIGSNSTRESVLFIETIDFTEKTLFDNSFVSYEHLTYSSVLDSTGYKLITRKRNIKLGEIESDTTYSFMQYNSVTEFLTKFFNVTNVELSLPIYNIKTSEVHKLHIGIIYNENSNLTFIMLIPKGSMWNIGSISNITHVLDLNVYTDILIVKQEIQLRGRLKNNISLQTNELTQSDTVFENIPIGQKNSNDIISNWQNGRETKTLTVYCHDYYDENGTKVVGDGTDKPLIEVNDLVKIYPKKNKSISYNPDGTEKVFRVTSAELNYSGQPRLTLQVLEEKL